MDGRTLVSGYASNEVALGQLAQAFVHTSSANVGDLGNQA